MIAIIFIPLTIKQALILSALVSLLIVGTGLVQYFKRRPTYLLYLLPISTLLIPTFPIAGDLSVNLNLALIPLLIVSTIIHNFSITLPKKYSLMMLLLIGIVLLSGLRVGVTQSAYDMLLGWAFFIQWLLYLLLPIGVYMIFQQLNLNEQFVVIRNALVISFFASLIIVIHLVGVQLNVLPAIAGGEKVSRVAGHYRLRTFWEQGPNVTGMFLVTQFLLSITFVIKPVLSSLRQRAILTIYSFVCFILIWYTFSRSALVALITGMMVLSLVSFSKKTIGTLILSALPAFMISFYLSPSWVKARYFNRLFADRYIENLGYTLPVGPLSQRLNYWIGLLFHYWTHPFIGDGFFIIATDSSYINLIVGVGFIGLFAQLLVFSHMLRSSYHIYVTTQNEFIRTLSIGTCAAFTGLLAWGAFSELWGRFRVIGIIFLLVGLVVATSWSRHKAV